MMTKYEIEYTVPCYDTDASWRMKPTSFMNIAQEAAGTHAVHLGFGYDVLRTTNTAWILSRVHVEFIDTPLWRDEIILKTWHKGLNRLFFLRDFIVTDRQGKERIKATTSWLVLDLETRRLVRDPKLMDEDTICTDNVIESPADKVVMPKGIEPEFVMNHVVSYSDIDQNGHTNNAMYMQWAMDAVDYQTASEKPVKWFVINFNHETKAGDNVQIFKVVLEKEDGLHFFVEGRVAEQSAFIVEILF